MSQKCLRRQGSQSRQPENTHIDSIEKRHASLECSTRDKMRERERDGALEKRARKIRSNLNKYLSEPSYLRRQDIDTSFNEYCAKYGHENFELVDK